MRKQTATVFRRTRLMAFLTVCTAILFSLEATAVEVDQDRGNDALGTMWLLGDTFGKANPDMKVMVLPSLGTSGAIKAVPKGAVDIGLSSRPLTEEERKPGAIAVEYARTPLVFVATKTLVRTLTLPDSRYLQRQDGALVERLSDSAGFAPIRRRQYAAVKPHVAGARQSVVRGGTTLGHALRDDRSGGRRQDGEHTRRAGGHDAEPDQLGGPSIAGIDAEWRRGVGRNGASGAYPHVKRFYLITQSNPSAAVNRFIVFLQSPAGRDILNRAGHWMPDGRS